MASRDFHCIWVTAAEEGKKNQESAEGWKEKEEGHASSVRSSLPNPDRIHVHCTHSEFQSMKAAD